MRFLSVSLALLALSVSVRADVRMDARSAIRVERLGPAADELRHAG